MGAIVSMLWPKNVEVARRYVAQAPAKVHTPQSLMSLLDDAASAQLARDARVRAEAVSFGERGSRRDAVLRRNLEARLFEAMRYVAALDKAHERDGIDEIVLNEDLMIPGKTAAAWGKARGVPVTVVSHSCIMGHLYTVHRRLTAGRLTVFGPRGAQPYVDDLGVPPSQVVVTGNPGWDVYAGLLGQRAAVRDEMRRAHGLAGQEHVVLFATTWASFFSAFADASCYERTTRAVVRAVRALRDLGVPVQLVLKERAGNAGKESGRDRIIEEEAIGFTPLVVDGDLERWILAADAVVSVDSNVAIEAGIAQVPSVNLWSPRSWLRGPFFGAEDGVLEAAEDDVAIALANVLGDPALRSRLTALATAQRERFAANVGAAAAKTAEVLLQTRRPVEREMRYVWQELSSPRSVADKGQDSVYYRSARHDMIAHISGSPRLVLDVGCGAGATGAAVKERFPQATVVGIEINAEAGALAAPRLDRVIVDNVEELDFASAGFAPSSIELVFFPDVLEHLYDPWRLLVRLRPFLAETAQIIASIPNSRNLWLLSQLAGGDWPYAEEGLLDVTHIRFFTKKTMIDLFSQTGYRVKALYSNPDGRIPAIAVPENGAVNVDLPGVQLKNVNPQDAIELRTLQFIVLAEPLAQPAARQSAG